MVEAGNSSADDPRLLFVFRHAPYGSASAREALEAVLAAGVHGLDPDALFLDDGVWQLLAGQDGRPLGAKTHCAMLGALPIYGVERLYVDTASLTVRGVVPATLIPAVTYLDAEEVKALLADSRKILNF
jgi:tRNA 2-thiouridine synthesizing protein C